MDTTLSLQRTAIEKTATSAAGTAILLIFLLTQIPIINAKDTDLGKFTGISPTISYIAEQDEKELIFDREVRYKYAGARINDIEKGIKHVKMIRYYNGRPVRINLIEISKDVNGDLDVVPAIASDTLASRTKISKIAEREHARAPMVSVSPPSSAERNMVFTGSSV